MIPNVSNENTMRSGGRRGVKVLAFSVVILMTLYWGPAWYVLNVTITPTRKRLAVAPSELGFPEAEEFTFNSAADRLHLRGWVVPSTENRALVLVHGIHSHAWNGHAREVVRAYVEAGFHVLLFDLRAHGASDGKHIGLGLVERGDVRAAVNVLLDRGFVPGRIGIHGTSYGAAIALLAAADIQEIGAVIADSAFADVRDVISREIRRQTGLPTGVGNALLPGMRILALGLYSLDISRSVPEAVISDISPRPVLLIHGTDDSVVPFEQAQRLKAAAGPTVELWALPGRGHTEGVGLLPDFEKASPTREMYLRKVTEFLHGAL